MLLLEPVVSGPRYQVGQERDCLRHSEMARWRNWHARHPTSSGGGLGNHLAGRGATLSYPNRRANATVCCLTQKNALDNTLDNKKAGAPPKVEERLQVLVNLVECLEAVAQVAKRGIVVTATGPIFGMGHAAI